MTVAEREKKYRDEQLEAAEVILENPIPSGGPDGSQVKWAREVLERWTLEDRK